MDLKFADFMELIVTPITVLVGLLGNVVSIFVLRDKEIQLRRSFTRLLIALAIFDITFIASSGSMFSLRYFSDYYSKYIYPYMVPVMLPVAQISMTASVYTTVFTCFDRYIAICRPALLSCCGNSEEATSWSLIIGTVVFSVLYNFSRFFEYRTETIVVVPAWEDEESFGQVTNGSLQDLQNRTELIVLPTDLRESKSYISYYILMSNFIFMGVLPMLTMIILNVLVVKEVNEANKRRARLTKRHQRNMTVTSMLMTVVLVFLICHSVKLIINGFEVWELIKTGSQGPSGDESSDYDGETYTQDPSEFSSMGYEHLFGETSTFYEKLNFPDDFFHNYTRTMISMMNESDHIHIPGDFDAEAASRAAAAAAKMAASEYNLTTIKSTTLEYDKYIFDDDVGELSDEHHAEEMEEGEDVEHWPTWIDYLTSISHWLLILNSSCNIFIYLHKDPRFMAVFKRMVMRLLRMPLILPSDSPTANGGGGVQSDGGATNGAADRRAGSRRTKVGDVNIEAGEKCLEDGEEGRCQNGALNPELDPVTRRTCLSMSVSPDEVVVNGDVSSSNQHSPPTAVEEEEEEENVDEEKKSLIVKQSFSHFETNVETVKLKENGHFSTQAVIELGAIVDNVNGNHSGTPVEISNDLNVGISQL